MAFTFFSDYYCFLHFLHHDVLDKPDSMIMLWFLSLSEDSNACSTSHYHWAYNAAESPWNRAVHLERSPLILKFLRKWFLQNYLMHPQKSKGTPCTSNFGMFLLVPPSKASTGKKANAGPLMSTRKFCNYMKNRVRRLKTNVITTINISHPWRAKLTSFHIGQIITQ